MRIWLFRIGCVLWAVFGWGTAAFAADRAVAGHAEDASFSCARTVRPVERRICSSPYLMLRRVDRDLAKWYRRALAGSADRAALRAEQRQWHQGLERCLTAEPVESASFVCKDVKPPGGRLQCLRDVCILDRYHERMKVLHRTSTARLQGRYVPSDQWPSGLRATLATVDAADRPLCRAVASSLARLGPMSQPLQQDHRFRFQAPWPQLDWQPLPKEQVLPRAQLFETMLREHWKHPVDGATSKPFLDLLAARVGTGELDIAVAPYPPSYRQPSGQTGAVHLIRYQRWGKGSVTTDMDRYQAVEFFQSEGLQSTRLDVLGGGDDAFVYQGRAYVASLSHRSFDNAWQHLPLPQPELIVSKVVPDYRGWATLVTACRLLYVGPL